MRICLITDFGTRDPYVAEVKGVIAGRTDVPVIDLTHEIAPFDAWEAAFFLRAIQRDWPAETIFVVIVDPGVGTSRRILVVESDGNVFLAPDNGALTFIDGPARSVENESLFLPDGNTTFHGRDRFAPVAAAIANGVSIESLGPQVNDRIRIDYTPPTSQGGTIVAIDRFGNAITDIPRPATGRPSLRVRGATLSRWSTTYQGNEPFLIVGSTGCIEISVAGGSAEEALKLRRGDPIEIVTR